MTTILRKTVLTILMPFCMALQTMAQYTPEHPLVFEGAQDLWPYSFLNEKGEPDGFNIDLMKLILGKLNIPYEIRMKQRTTTFQDLKSGEADLMIGLTAGFHEEVGGYSKNPVTLFTQSILSPKSHPTEVRNFHDLANHRVYVNDSSLCHHLMRDYGWEKNAIPTKSIAETIQKISTDEEGELVWNTLSLKWMLRKYQIDNLEITPVNMPHGEYRFISNDQHLLDQLDSVYAQLNSSDQLLPLQNKWFYPERKEEVTPQWVWYVGAGSALLVFILIFYTIIYQLQASRIIRNNTRRNRQLSLILETSGVRIWTYDIASQMFTWRNEYGQPAYLYTIEEFSQRYTTEDFNRLQQAMGELSQKLPDKDGREEEITLNIKAKDAREDGDTEMRDFVIVLSVLRRDERNNPIELIGTKKDVTVKREKERKAQERTMRYWAIMETPLVGIVLFDRQGRLANLNAKACQMYQCDKKEMQAEQPTFADFFGIDDMPLSQADGFQALQMALFDRMPQEQRRVKAVKRTTKLYCEYRFILINDDDGQPLSLFAICFDRTYIVQSKEAHEKSIAQLADMKAKEHEYVTSIDDFLHNGNTRMVIYSPQSHVLTIYDGSQHVQHILTPTRLMTLIDDRMTNKAIRIISNMDSCTQAETDTDIRTTLRIKGRITLHLHLHLKPTFDQNGKLKEYVGVMRDISVLKDIEHRLAMVEAQTQEIENTKTTFMRNMMEEIRTPMDKVIAGAAMLVPEHDAELEQPAKQQIMANAELLTQTINNILYLSRLEAHMVDIQKQPTDFTELFASYCQNGWERYKNADVKYIIENPYDKLVIDIDSEHLGNIIVQVARNAAQHTHSGAIRARYDYIGRRLMISIDDTGEGIAPEELAKLNHQLENGLHTSQGLGLAICKELITQMGGNLEIHSELALGTTVWITLPCHASTIKRKKIQ